MPMPMTFIRRTGGICFGALLLLLPGCMIGPGYRLPFPLPAEQSLPAGYKENPARFKAWDGW